MLGSTAISYYRYTDFSFDQISSVSLLYSMVRDYTACYARVVGIASFDSIFNCFFVTDPTKSKYCSSQIKIEQTMATTTRQLEDGQNPSKRPVCSFMDNGHYIRRNKRMKLQSKLAPCFDGWEFDSVGKALVLAARGSGPSSSESEQPAMSLEEALERVAIWKTRAQRIPHAVESTASLALLFWRESTRTSTVAELRFAYSCAILRSINGLADVSQQQRAVAASVASLCSHLGIPAWLVDIRHEASHNQLPPLPVLRMAATTLIEYYQQVYWEPVAKARRDGVERANSLLQAYKTATSSNVAQTPAASKPPSESKISSNETSNEKNTLQEDEDPEDSSSSEDDTEEWNNTSMVDVWGSSIGTTANRFAALEDTKKPAKKEKPEKPAPAKKQARPKKTKAPRGTPTPTSCAHQFVKSKLPVDVAFQSALSFLVWGGMGSGSPAGRGALIPGSPGSFPETNKGIEKVRHRYQPLLVTLGREWPGFLSALLIHLVDFILSIESAAEKDGMDAGSLRKLYFLDSWVRYVVSRRFVVNFDQSFKASETGDQSSGAAGTAPLSILQSLSYPLNCLCDRCDGEGAKDSPSSSSSPGRETSGGLADLFANILGPCRVHDFGVDLTTAGEGTQSLPETGADMPTPSLPERAANGSGMTLAEIEAMLEGGDATGESKKETLISAHPHSQTVRPAWLRCKVWEPCAVGTLPGYPM
jgi:hypothetical protein